MFRYEDVEVGQPVWVEVFSPIVGADKFVGTVMAVNPPFIRVSNETKPEDATPFSLVYLHNLDVLRGEHVSYSA